MARKVYLHIGAPKTGTTYLQALMHGNHDMLESVGVRYAAGQYRNDRVWATEVLRGFALRNRPSHAPGAWDRVLAQVRGWDRTAVFSHEFLGACTPEQADRAHRDLAPAEVHLVFTARDYAKQAAAVWQERLKYGYDVPFSDFSLDNDTPAWSWQTQDVAQILDRWRADLPADRIHVVTVPRTGSPPDELWRRFASVIGAEAAAVSEVPAANTSLGLVEAELLRRVDASVRERGLLQRPQDRAQLVRDVLANEVLSQGSRERFSPTPAQLEELTARATSSVDSLKAAGYHVVGSLDDLMPDEPTSTGTGGRRVPEDASADELLEAAVETITGLLGVLKERGRDRRAQEPRGAHEAGRDAGQESSEGSMRSRVGRAVRVLRGSGG